MTEKPLRHFGPLPGRHQKPYIRPQPPKRVASMTVCITAIAERKYLVYATDRMVSLELSIDDGIHKAAMFHDEWASLLSANDITNFVPVIDRACQLFAGRPNTLKAAGDVLVEAYAEERAERWERRILAPLGVSMGDFLRNGKDWFTPTERAEIRQRLENEMIDCEMLASGFDQEGEPHVFTMDSRAVPINFDKPGFWAIGTGGSAARTLLAFYGQSVGTPLSQTIYNVCAAKFMGEKAEGVGRETFFFIREKGSSAVILPYFLIPLLRDYWEKEGKPRIPQTAVQKVESCIRDGSIGCVSFDKETGKPIIPPSFPSSSEP